MTFNEAETLEKWLVQQWKESPELVPYAIMAELLKLVRANAR